MNIRLTLLVLFVTACHPPPKAGPYTVSGNVSPAQAAQALAMVEVAKNFLDHPHYLELENTIDFLVGPYAADGYCMVPAGMHVAGCAGWPVIVLVWPERGFGPDIRTTALAHELCEIGANNPDDVAADVCSAKVNALTPPLSNF